MCLVVITLIFLIPFLKIGFRELQDYKVYPFQLLCRIFFISLPLNGKEERVIRFLLILISQYHVHFKGQYYDEKNYIYNGAEFDNGIKCLYGLVNGPTGNKYDC